MLVIQWAFPVGHFRQPLGLAASVILSMLATAASAESFVVTASTPEVATLILDSRTRRFPHRTRYWVLYAFKRLRADGSDFVMQQEEVDCPSRTLNYISVYHYKFGKAQAVAANPFTSLRPLDVVPDSLMELHYNFFCLKRDVTRSDAKTLHVTASSVEEMAQRAREYLVDGSTVKP